VWRSLAADVDSGADEGSSEVNEGALKEDKSTEKVNSEISEGEDRSKDDEVDCKSLESSKSALERLVVEDSDESAEDGEEEGEDHGDPVISSLSSLGHNCNSFCRCEVGSLIVAQERSVEFSHSHHVQHDGGDERKDAESDESRSMSCKQEAPDCNHSEGICSAEHVSKSADLRSLHSKDNCSGEDW